MAGYFSTGQSPQWAVVLMEEEEEEGGGGGLWYVYLSVTLVPYIITSTSAWLLSCKCSDVYWREYFTLTGCPLLHHMFHGLRVLICTSLLTGLFCD
jgi:hypothetical protein